MKKVIFLLLLFVFCVSNRVDAQIVTIDSFRKLNDTICYILPTCEKDTVAQRIWNTKTKKNVYKTPVIILTDIEALKTNLSNYSLNVSGTVDGNLWLKKYVSHFPLKMSSTEIEGTKTYKGDSLWAMICFESPLYAGKSIKVYWTRHLKNLLGKNYSSDKSYSISDGKTKLESGYILKDKKNKWVCSQFPIVMTQEQMYQDYDSLASIIKNGFIETSINKKVFGIDVLKILETNRKKIANLKTTTDFIVLIHKTLEEIHGSHLWLNSTPKQFGLLNNPEFLKYANKADYSITEEYEKFVYNPANQSKIKLNIPLFEYQGEYYTKAFVYQGKKYESGLKVISCNGQTPDAIIAKNPALLCWNYDLKKKIDCEFYKTLELKKGNSIEFVFESKDKKTEKVKFDANITVQTDKNHLFEEKKIVYLDKDKLLYVRIPAMDTKAMEYYDKDLRKAIKENLTENIIIDIRGNQGGSDDIAGLFINLFNKHPENRFFPNTLIMKDWKPSREIFKGLKDSSFQLRKIDFLDNESMLTLKSRSRAEGDESIFKGKGKIYVIADNDVYSSAGTLLTFCKLLEEFVWVGLVNYKDLYSTGNPLFFALPNSRAVFSMTSCIAIGSEKTAEETQNVRPEVVVKPTLQEMEDLYLPTSLSLEEYLYQKDVFFKKVLSLIENDKK